MSRKYPLIARNSLKFRLSPDLIQSEFLGCSSLVSFSRSTCRSTGRDIRSFTELGTILITSRVQPIITRSDMKNSCRTGLDYHSLLTPSRSGLTPFRDRITARGKRGEKLKTRFLLLRLDKRGEVLR